MVLAITACAAGCATPSAASSAVRVTTTLAEVDGCTLLDKVVVADTPNAEQEARDKVASLGGNVLLRKDELVWNGNAYKCPAAGH